MLYLENNAGATLYNQAQINSCGGFVWADLGDLSTNRLHNSEAYQIGILKQCCASRKSPCAIDTTSRPLVQFSGDRLPTIEGNDSNSLRLTPP